jgi:hypothetical protein
MSSAFARVLSYLSIKDKLQVTFAEKTMEELNRVTASILDVGCFDLSSQLTKQP